MNRRRWFRRAAAVFMIDIVRRLFSDARPIDILILVVDFLVLAVILYFEGGEKLHKRKMRRQVLALASFMERGRKLQASTPDPVVASDAIDEWIEQVKLWGSETQDFLSSRSMRASSAFTHIVNVTAVDREVRSSDGRMFHVAGYFGDAYQLLQLKLDNLHKIMVNPEAYF